MSRDADRYSQTVGWLKVALPMVGLGILSTLFLFARETRIERRESGTELLAPDGGVEVIGRPDYTGVTVDGTGISITAERAWPRADDSGAFEGSTVTARFDLPNGDTADIRSDRGELRPDEDILSLRGEVVVDTASGWTVRSDALDASLDWTRLVSPDAVHTEGPIGTLDAGAMIITRDNAVGDAYLMEFDGGVRLVYQP